MKPIDERTEKALEMLDTAYHVRHDEIDFIPFHVKFISYTLSVFALTTVSFILILIFVFRSRNYSPVNIAVTASNFGILLIFESIFSVYARIQFSLESALVSGLSPGISRQNRVENGVRKGSGFLEMNSTVTGVVGVILLIPSLLVYLLIYRET